MIGVCYIWYGQWKQEVQREHFPTIQCDLAEYEGDGIVIVEVFRLVSVGDGSMHEEKYIQYRHVQR